MSDFEAKLAELKERIDVYKILFMTKKPKYIVDYPKANQVN